MSGERQLGRTGLRVSPVGLGLAALGRPGYLNLGHGEDLGERRGVADLERRTREVLDAAVAAGVRYVDAARSYGLAERFLAGWLADRGTQAPPVTVGSKWGYAYTADWRVEAEQHEVKEHSLAQLDRQLAESRAELGSALQLYQIHSATLDSGVLDDRQVLGRLAELADGGLVVGLSTSGPQQAATIRAALDVEVDGVNPFRCVQTTWNLLEPSAGAALAEARDAGWGVIVKEAVANGRLTPRGDGAALKSLRAAATEAGVGVDAIAIAAALAQPFPDVVLSGAATVAHLHGNLHALKIPAAAVPGPDDVAEPPEAYWMRRSSLAWT